MLEPGDLYLDHNASSPLLPQVRAALARALELELANPASAHRAGERSRRLLEEARESVAALLRVAPAELLFTSGATEANHLALFGLVAPEFRSAHVVASAIEHSSLLDAARLLGELGATVDLVAPTPDGVVPAEAVVAALRPETKLVALMAANNETGVRQPVAELAPLLRARGISFHVDAAQAIGRVPFDVAALGATTVAVSAHKLGGPAGSGALHLRKGRRLVPFVRGGRQERGLRGGTHNLLGAIGFGAAARACLDAGDRADEVARVRDEFERALARLRPDARILGAAVARLPNTTAVTFPGVDATRLLHELSRRGLHASMGSACQAGAPEPSHVLRAMGLAAAEARATMRFSFGREPSAADAGDAAERIAAALGGLGRGGT